MNEKTSTSSKKRKTLSVILAVVMVLTMLLSGTLAYYYSSKAVNTFSNTKKQVIGHDDFVEGVNKDVWVENIGSSPVYVRVKLTEDFILEGEKIVDPASPVNHIPTASSPSVHTPKDAKDTIHDYFEWSMGDTSTAASRVLRSAKDKAFTDGSVPGITFDATQNIAKDGTNTAYHHDIAAFDNVELVTVLNAKTILMSEYKTKSDEWKRNFTGWVADTNGWYYWSQMVQTNAATGLLLDNVQIKDDKKAELADKDYTYHINVTFQAVDETDKHLWEDGKTGDIDSAGRPITMEAVDWATDDAKDLMAQAKAANPVTAELQNEINAVNTKLSSATSKAAQDVYKKALDAATNFSNYSVETLAQQVHELRTIGDAIEAKQNNGELAALQANTVLQLENGSIAGSAGITDSVIAKEMLTDYDFNNDGKIDGEEALAVVDLKVDGATNLTGITTDNFTNLQGINFNNLNFAQEDTNKAIDLTPLKNLKRLTITRSNVQTINLAPVASTLEKCFVEFCSDLKPITGLANLTNVNYLDLRLVRVNLTDLNTCLTTLGPKLETLLIAYVTLEAGSSGKNVRDVASLGISGNTALKSLTIGEVFTTGTLNLEQVKGTLETLWFAGPAGSTLQCSDLSQHTKLKSVDGRSNVTFNGLPAWIPE